MNSTLNSIPVLTPVKLRHSKTINRRLSFALVMMLGYGFIQWRVLTTGNLAEDAYILYEYVNHFVAGQGISYNKNAGPVEGATDFLWLMLLSLLGFAGIAPPVAAGILNTLGFGLIGWVFASVLQESEPKLLETHVAPQWSNNTWFSGFVGRHHYRLHLQYLGWLGLLLTFLFSHFVFAGYTGFSTVLYAGLIVLSLKRLLNHDPASYRDLPLLAIILGLFRPDGVILGVVMVFLKAYFALKLKYFKRFALWSFVAFGIGVAYFIWRYQYFGELLPLPLYVKSDSTATFAGYYPNLKWAYENSHWFLLTALFVLISRSWNLVYILVPGFVLFLMLMTSTQTQNVGNRFQMPLFISLIFFLAASWYRVNWRFAQPTFILVTFAFLHVVMCYRDLPESMQNRMAGRHYVAPFARLIEPFVDTSTIIAVTEAGRIAYFNDATIVDLVGLNTPALAKTRVSLAYLQNLSPDMVFFYHDMKITPLQGKTGQAKAGEIIQLSSEAFSSKVIRSDLYKHDDENREREIYAASAAIDYLDSASADYDFYFMYMHEVQEHRHVFAIKNTAAHKEKIIEALYQSQHLPSDYFNVMAL